jgi:hypothetical protein
LLESRERQRFLPAYCLTFVLYAIVNKVDGLGLATLFGSLAVWSGARPLPALLHAIWS